MSIWSTVNAAEFDVWLLLVVVGGDVVCVVVTDVVVVFIWEFGVCGEMFALLDVVVGVFGDTVVALEFGAVSAALEGLVDAEPGLDVEPEGMMEPAEFSWGFFSGCEVGELDVSILSVFFWGLFGCVR